MRTEENRTQHTASLEKKSGMVLLTVVTMLALISLVAASMISVNMAELKSAAYATAAQRAFYNAEGGARYSINKINADIRSGTFSLS